MNSDDSFHEIMGRLRSRGSSAALQRVVQQFETRLQTLANGQLVAAGVRTRVSPDDILQSVFMTFWKRCKSEQGQQWELNDWNDLWRLLRTFTLRRCRRHIRAHRGATRDAQRDQTLSLGETQLEISNKEPDPLETLAFAELLGQLLDALGPLEQLVLLRLIEGGSRESISRELNCTYRTISRRIARTKDVLRKLMDDQSSFDL